MIVYRIGEASIHVDDGRCWLETVFFDGSRVPACPEDTDEYRATALRLGYGADTWSMCRDHELGHSWLAVSRGVGEFAARLDYSPTLWAVAHGGVFWDAVREEKVVLEWQRQLVKDGPRPWDSPVLVPSVPVDVEDEDEFYGTGGFWT